ncbi:hypothetical protein HYW54_03385 [Candidatus Gottesmanbacteria bacterium]|nr:hypothetical protein [Candidatus Gottesmanbacteria bacterium]
MKYVVDHFKRVDFLLYDVCEIIIQQQLSEKVGDVIFERFQKLFKGEITAEKVSKITDEKIRKVGTSRRCVFVWRFRFEAGDTKII